MDIIANIILTQPSQVVTVIPHVTDKEYAECLHLILAGGHAINSPLPAKLTTTTQTHNRKDNLLQELRQLILKLHLSFQFH